MPTGFLKGDFDLPALDKPFDDPPRRLPIRAEQGLGFKLLTRVSDNHPPDRHRFLPDVIPHTFAARDFYFPFFLTIPSLDFKPFPLCLWIINDGLQRRQSNAFFARSPHLSRLFRVGAFIQCRIVSQS